jgi:aspartyl aminopeptidase
VQLTPILAEVVEKEYVHLKIGLASSVALNIPYTTLSYWNCSLVKSESQVSYINTGDKIRDFEVCLYDTQAASLGGLNEEFIHSARLDNLMMSFCALNALAETSSSVPADSLIRVVALFDNEEVGSNTAHGADSNLLEVTIKRLSSLQSHDKVSIVN